MNIKTVQTSMIKRASFWDWLMGVDTTHDSDPKKPKFTEAKPEKPDRWSGDYSEGIRGDEDFDNDMIRYSNEKKKYDAKYSKFKEELEAYMADKNDPHAGEKFYKNIYRPWQLQREGIIRGIYEPGRGFKPDADDVIKIRSPKTQVAGSQGE